jgi:hypothetical protein
MKYERFAQELRAFLDHVGLRGNKLTLFLQTAGISPDRMKRWRRGADLPSVKYWKNIRRVGEHAWPSNTPNGELFAKLDDEFNKHNKKSMAAQRSGRPANTHIADSTNQESHVTSSALIGDNKQERPLPFHTVAARAHLSAQVAAAGLTAFYPSREFYRKYRDTATIAQYVSTANHSVVMVSINLMTGVPIEGLCEALTAKLKANKTFTVTISLIDPEKLYLMKTLAPVLNTTPASLAHSIRASLIQLASERASLPLRARTRFLIRVHNTIPMGSAILLDHRDPSGRIQIESKVYKAAPLKSFAFEVMQTGVDGFYETLATGYDDLVKDGRDWTSSQSKE